MANKTAQMRANEEAIKQKIVRAHRAGLTDKNGRGLVRPVVGTGHLHFTTVPVGPERYNVWPRDRDGNLIGDD